MKTIAIVLWVVLTAFSESFSAGPMPIKFGTLAPQGSPWDLIMREMGESLKTETAGGIDLRIYSGGVAGDEPDMVRKMRIGQLHAAALTVMGLGQIAPEMNALQMPMLLSSFDELDFVMDRMSPTFDTILEKQGFKVLNWLDAGWVHLFSQAPVVRPADLKRQKLFVWSGDTAAVEAWKAEGFSPVPLPATDIYTGLQSGLINAFSTTPLAALSFQWFALAPNMMDLKWAPLVGATIVTAKKWQEIPDNQKTVLLRLAAAAGDRMRKENRKLGDDAVEIMKRHGLAVVPVPRDVAADWERSARATYPRLLEKGNPTEILHAIEKVRNDYRASHPRY
ncbi:MAG: TRAP transporter substrate-binding protein DctP [Hyphomicrobiales bacterium]